MNRALFSAKL
uniref:Uncharacterized protein n=1 Tax=Anguilla anguilla TaxID=7936 RepID=A0A0E9QUV8_ANGAN